MEEELPCLVGYDIILKKKKKIEEIYSFCSYVFVIFQIGRIEKKSINLVGFLLILSFIIISSFPC